MPLSLPASVQHLVASCLNTQITKGASQQRVLPSTLTRIRPPAHSHSLLELAMLCKQCLLEDPELGDFVRPYSPRCQPSRRTSSCRHYLECAATQQSRVEVRTGCKMRGFRPYSCQSTAQRLSSHDFVCFRHSTHLCFAPEMHSLPTI